MAVLKVNADNETSLQMLGEAYKTYAMSLKWQILTIV